MADILIINKERTAKKSGISAVKYNARKYNPGALLIDAASRITVSEPERIKGKKVLVVEDGPTITHGGMAYGAGTIAARQAGCKTADPRPHLLGSMKKVYEKYPHIGKVLPAMGYSTSQIKELEKIINATECDAVISGTPIDLRRVLKSGKPIIRIRYDLEIIGKPGLEKAVRKFARGL